MTSTTATTSRSSNDVSPDVSGGPRRMAPVVLVGWTALTCTYVALLRIFHDSPTILGLNQAADEFRVACIDNQGRSCNRVDMFAFQAASGIALTLCGALGFVTWHITKRSHTALPSTSQGRLFGYLPEAELLAAMNFTFQSWDFCVSLFIPEHATAIMLSHHVMASTVSWLSIQYSVLHYYSVFFLGLTEVSSIFLIFVDLAKYFPPIPDTTFDAFIRLFCAPLFAVTFIYYRVILWWPESWRLFQDIRTVHANGLAGKLRPGTGWIFFLFLACNLPLGLLQLYWLTIIFAEAGKIVQAGLVK